jgi:hypothetical protein
MTLHWQDVIFSLGGIGFLISMMGSIVSKTQKPPRVSCIITAFWLWLFVIVYASYGLWFSTGTGVLSALGWTVLSFQRRVSWNLIMNTK